VLKANSQMVSGAIYASKSLSRPTRHCASPNGGRSPLDLKSRDPSFQTDITRRFDKDADADGQLDKAVRGVAVPRGGIAYTPTEAASKA